MTTTSQAHGGGAQPARIDTSGKITGGAAMRVYGFDSEADARAAGFVCEGGPAMSVAIVTDAQLASGAWKLDGDPFATIIYTAPDSLPAEGGFAVPVYPVNGWGSAPAPVAPLFDSAEIGTVNAFTLDVTFDQDVSASDYSDGVTIKVNGTATSITSATRQSNHAIVRYVIPVLWHGSGDAVTWEYNSGTGNIVAESGGAALADVTAQSVTNNCEYTGIVDCQADTLSLNNNDPVSTLPNVGTVGGSFGNTGAARPAFATNDGGGYKALFFNSPNNEPQILMATSEINTALSDVPFTVMAIGTQNQFAYGDHFVSKYENQIPATVTLKGWDLEPGSGIFDIVDVYNSDQSAAYRTATLQLSSYDGLKHIWTGEGISLSEVHCYVDGSNAGEVITSEATVQSIANNVPVTIGATSGDSVNYLYGYINSVMAFSPRPNATNRAALEARLAARYGITL